MARLIQGQDDEWVLRDDWGIDDIRSCAESENICDADELSDEDCINVMKIAETGFDANIGLNWESIGAALEIYLTCKADGTPMFYRGKPIKVTA